MPTQERKPIGIDIDGTLANTIENWIGLVSREYGINISINDITRYDLEDITGLSTDTISEIYKKVWSNYKEIKPASKSIPKVLKELKTEYKIEIITASVGSSENIKSWLSLNDIYYDSFAHYNSNEEKLNAKADIFIDDNPDLIINYAKMGKKAILIKHPWNENCNAEEYGVEIAKDWDDVYRLLSK
jgi:uncharacterized HAD superfamily protein